MGYNTLRCHNLGLLYPEPHQLKGTEEGHPQGFPWALSPACPMLLLKATEYVHCDMSTERSTQEQRRRLQPVRLSIHFRLQPQPSGLRLVTLSSHLFFPFFPVPPPFAEQLSLLRYLVSLTLYTRSLPCVFHPGSPLMPEGQTRSPPFLFHLDVGLLGRALCCSRATT